MLGHYLQLQDANTVATAYLKQTQRAIGDLVAARAMGVVYGEAGLGKTFAVERSFEALEVRPAEIDFALRTTTKGLIVKLLEALTGVRHQGTQTRLEPLLLDALRETPRAVKIDEGQRLHYEAVEFLRFLHDDPETQFALVIVGGNGCYELLTRYPMLCSRFYRWVEFHRLREDELLRFLPRFHPLYESADPGLLRKVDRELGRGNLRSWAAFTKTAADLITEHGLDGLTTEVVDNALYLFPSPPDDL